MCCLWSDWEMDVAAGCIPLQPSLMGVVAGWLTWEPRVGIPDRIEEVLLLSLHFLAGKGYPMSFTHWGKGGGGGLVSLVWQKEGFLLPASAEDAAKFRRVKRLRATAQKIVIHIHMSQTGSNIQTAGRSNSLSDCVEVFISQIVLFCGQKQRNLSRSRAVQGRNEEIASSSKSTTN